MKELKEIFEELKKPFGYEDIEWRVARVGQGNNGPWAQVLAYVTNRAIQDRLDSVFTPFGWDNEYRPGPQGGIICGISVYFDGEKRTKWDGAENTQVESVKGGLSDSMKRAAVQWGIGRYLYRLPAVQYAVIEQSRDKAMHYQPANKNKGTAAFYWNPPGLPDWAVGE